MKEYIEKEKLFDCLDIKNALGGHYGISLTAINAIPAADVVEVRTGRWILNTVRDEWQQFHSDPECSECGFHPYYYHDHSVMKYCPNCGAKMDGGADDAAD